MPAPGRRPWAPDPASILTTPVSSSRLEAGILTPAPRRELSHLIDEWGLGVPHVVGPDVCTAAALFLAAKTPERVTSLAIGGGAVRFPIDAGGALKEIIEAPTLDEVRALDARTNIGYAVEPAAPSVSEPEVHEDYVSAYDLGALRRVGAVCADLPRTEPGAARSAATRCGPVGQPHSGSSP